MQPDLKLPVDTLVLDNPRISALYSQLMASNQQVKQEERMLPSSWISAIADMAIVGLDHLLSTILRTTYAHRPAMTRTKGRNPKPD